MKISEMIILIDFFFEKTKKRERKGIQPDHPSKYCEEMRGRKKNGTAKQ